MLNPLAPAFPCALLARCLAPFMLTATLLLIPAGLPDGSAVSTAAADEPAVDWVRVTEHAAWQPRDSCAEMTFGGRMWIMGGWFDSFSEPPADVWSSADGKTWDKVAAKAPWKHSDLPMSLTFRDRMWVMGGWHNGRLPDASASHEVWSTTDGVEWKQDTKEAGWSPRLAAGSAVFKDRMWILGGIEKYYFGTSKDLRNDVWSSADGKTWERATENAGWSPRAYHQAVALGGKLYVLGGGNYVPEYHAKNDVWSSEDGVTWTQLTDKAPWSPRLWHSAVAYRDRLWVIGGWSNNPHRNWNDVWHSADGKTWEKLETPTLWKERHEHSVYVHDDAIWLAAGHAQPLSNEVWKLQLPRDWPAKLKPQSP